MAKQSPLQPLFEPASSERDTGIDTGGNFLGSPGMPYTEEKPRTQISLTMVRKALLRLFRRYLKKDTIRPSLALKITRSPLHSQGHLIMHALNLPNEIQADPKTPLALLMLFRSHRITQKRILVP